MNRIETLSQRAPILTNIVGAGSIIIAIIGIAQSIFSGNWFAAVSYFFLGTACLGFWRLGNFDQEIAKTTKQTEYSIQHLEKERTALELDRKQFEQDKKDIQKSNQELQKSLQELKQEQIKVETTVARLVLLNKNLKTEIDSLIKEKNNIEISFNNLKDALEEEKKTNQQISENLLATQKMEQSFSGELTELKQTLDRIKERETKVSAREQKVEQEEEILIQEQEKFLQEQEKLLQEQEKN